MATNSSQEVKEEETRIGCEHYERKWALYCSQWEEFHICRFCHDEKWESCLKDMKKSHNLDRHNIK